MKILLVEDQERKALDAMACLHALGTVRHVWSFVGAKRALREEWADVLILDMTLPIFSGPQGGEATSYVYGGEELLKWAVPRCQVPPTVLFTQFDTFTDRSITESLATLEQRLKADYPRVVRGAVLYGVGLGWEQDLLQKSSAAVLE